MSTLRENLRLMIQAYLVCAHWTDCEEDHPEEDYDPAPEAQRSMLCDCMDFYRQARPHLALYHEQAPTFEAMGNDLWLTRNHHGAGFWDRGLGQLGDILTKIAHGMGEQHAVVGDDGLLYLE